jgi:hypothetical protein
LEKDEKKIHPRKKIYFLLDYFFCVWHFYFHKHAQVMEWGERGGLNGLWACSIMDDNRRRILWIFRTFYARIHLRWKLFFIIFLRGIFKIFIIFYFFSCEESRAI